MRDILNKLYSIVSETQLNPRDPKGDYEAKKQALDDLEADPVASQDPEISAAIDQRRADLEKEAQSAGVFEVGDNFGISFSEDLEISTEIVGFVEDGIVIELDDHALELLTNEGISFLEGELVEGLRDPKDNPCWKGYKPVGTKKKNGKTVPNCVPKESIEEKAPPGAKAERMVKHIKKGYAKDGKLTDKEKSIAYATAWKQHNKEKNESVESEVDEAEYQGKEVPLGKKLPGDVKKSKVYVRKPNGKVVKVNFGDKKMRIKKSNPARRKSFRARHNCKNPGPRWKARYWSCRSW